MKYSSYHKGDLIESRHGFNIIDCDWSGKVDERPIISGTKIEIES